MSEKPPSCNSEEPPLIEENREPVQLASSSGLFIRALRGSSVGCRELVFVCHSPGSKPLIWAFDSTGLY